MPLTKTQKRFAGRVLARTTIGKKIELPPDPPKPEEPALPRFPTLDDLVHTEPCGCKVTFFGESAHRSSRRESCEKHRHAKRAELDAIYNRALAKRGRL